MLRSANKNLRVETRQGGVTLIEVVIAMVLLGIASTLIIMLQSTLSMIQLTARGGQSLIEARQECAEEILMVRHRNGFGALSSANGLLDPDNNPGTPPPICEALWNAMGKDIAATIYVTANFNQDTRASTPGVSGAFCPAGYTCKEVYIPAAGAERTFLPFSDVDN